MASSNPEAMLHSLRNGGGTALAGEPFQVSDRKLRLWACACLLHADQAILAARNRRGSDIYDYGDDGEKIRDSELVGVARDWAADQREYDPSPATKAGLLRCIVGNPFRPVTIHPAWRSTCVLGTWTVADMAQGIYDRRAFEQLPFLADALEDADCTDAAILAHLRGPGPHASGCHVVDLLLGKN